MCKKIFDVCDDSLVEEMFALMKLHVIVFLHITNRAVYMENTRLYIQDKGEGEKRIESINNTNDSDTGAHT